MKNKLKRVIDHFNQNAFMIDQKLAMLGFDGFIDSIARVVKKREYDQEPVYFNRIEEFGNYLASKSGFSGTIELTETITKIGGNMPIMSNALGRLGLNVRCIGAFGMPDIKSEFRSMKKANCTINSVCEPGNTLALEFNDGKIMLARMGSLDSLKWEDIRKIVGLEELSKLYLKSGLVAILNWSEIKNSTSILEGFLNEVVMGNKPDKQKLMFIDISDCSKHDKKNLMKALLLIGKFSYYNKIILGLNENEARLVYRSISENKEPYHIEQIGNVIYEKLGIDVVVIHPYNCSICWDNTGYHRIDNLFITEPKITTGGGDNFNAGFCAGQLLGFDLEESMIIANAVSGFYIKNGFSPDCEEVSQYLKQWESVI